MGAMPKLAGLGVLVMAATAPAQARTFAYSPLPAQPAGVPWPTAEWSRGALGKNVDARRLSATIDALVETRDPMLGKTNAILVIHRGRIVAERYRPGYRCDQSIHTMSVAKMMGSVMAGLMVAEGKARLDAPTGLPYWPAGDPRTGITLRHVLTMTTGLGWEEEGDGSFIDLAFGSGYKDLARYTALQPLRHRPGTKFQYSDGTPSLIGAMALAREGGTRSAVARWVRESVLRPLGMRRTELEFDQQGTWYGSSGVRWSPCDLARFGLFLMRDGQWDGRRILPAGWVNAMRTPSAATLAGKAPAGAPETATLYYGFNTFVWDLAPSVVRRTASTGIPVDAFGHAGFGGHALRIVPSRDVILVIAGVGADEQTGYLRRTRLFRQITDAFPVTPR